MTVPTRLVVAVILLLAATESSAVYTVDGQRKSFEIYRASSRQTSSSRRPSIVGAEEAR